MANKVEGKNDDLRRLHLDDTEFDSSTIEDVFLLDTSLETLLFGHQTTEKTDIVDVSIPQVKRSY